MNWLDPVHWNISWRFVSDGIAFLVVLFGGIRGHGSLRGKGFGLWFLLLLVLAGLAIYFAALPR